MLERADSKSAEGSGLTTAPGPEPLDAAGSSLARSRHRFAPLVGALLLSRSFISLLALDRGIGTQPGTSVRV